MGIVTYRAVRVKQDVVIPRWIGYPLMLALWAGGGYGFYKLPYVLPWNLIFLFVLLTGAVIFAFTAEYGTKTMAVREPIDLSYVPPPPPPQRRKLSRCQWCGYQLDLQERDCPKCGGPRE